MLFFVLQISSFEASSKKLYIITAENVEKKAIWVKQKLQRDRKAHFVVSCIVAYASMLPMIKLMAAESASDTTRTVIDCRNPVVGFVSDFFTHTKNYVFSRNFVFDVATGMCTTVLSSLVYRVAGRVCYREKIGSFCGIYAPWEQDIDLAESYIAELIDKETPSNRIYFYQNSLHEVLNITMKHVELVLAFMEYQTSKEKNDEFRLTRLALVQYLMHTVNGIAEKIDQELSKEVPNYLLVKTQFGELSKEVGREVRHAELSV